MEKDTRQVKLGMPTLIELPDIEANVELAHRLRLSFVEINMDCPPFLPESLPPEKLIRLRQESGVSFTMHLPERLDLGAFQNSIRCGYLEFYREAIMWAGEAGIPLANMHLSEGVYFTLPDRKVWLYDAHRKEFLAGIEESFSELIELAEENHVTICAENTGVITGCVEACLILLLEKGVRLTYDVGHDATTGFANREFFDRHRHLIRHMHLHDSDGNRKNHQTLFSGVVDIPGMLRMAKEIDINVVIEVKTQDGLEESVSRLKSRGSSVM